MYALDVEHLTKRYAGVAAVEDLSFTVEPGRVTGFLGPNGAGKSTTMKVLLGLASADEGRITIGGAPYRQLPDPARTVGALIEPGAFHPARSGRSHLRVLADVIGVGSTRVDEVLALVDLGGAANRAVGGYSMGMQQRLGLAAALLGDPPVLVLDEPGNGLDPQGIRWLRGLLRQRAADGNTVFVSSHLLAEMEQLADELIVLDHGRLVTAGAMSSLQTVGTVVRTPTPGPLSALLREAGASVQLRADGALLVGTLPIDRIGDIIHAHRVLVHELSPQSGSLEELFMGWTHRADQPDMTISEGEVVPV
jgi:ABC-2 type transport system ATP-binding protein